MKIANDQQLANTQQKLNLCDEQIARAQSRPSSPANQASLRSLLRTRNELQSEINEYTAAHLHPTTRP
jgi:hypothetical protein